MITERKIEVRKKVKDRLGLMGRERFGRAGVGRSGERTVAVQKWSAKVSSKRERDGKKRKFS